jgi:hypothetical protein
MNGFGIPGNVCCGDGRCVVFVWGAGVLRLYSFSVRLPGFLVRSCLGGCNSRTSVYVAEFLLFLLVSCFLVLLFFWFRGLCC